MVKLVILINTIYKLNNIIFKYLIILCQFLSNKQKFNINLNKKLLKKNLTKYKTDINSNVVSTNFKLHILNVTYFKNKVL